MLGEVISAVASATSLAVVLYLLRHRKNASRTKTVVTTTTTTTTGGPPPKITITKDNGPNRVTLTTIVGQGPVTVDFTKYDAFSEAMESSNARFVSINGVDTRSMSLDQIIALLGNLNDNSHFRIILEGDLPRELTTRVVTVSVQHQPARV